MGGWMFVSGKGEGGGGTGMEGGGVIGKEGERNAWAG